MKNIPEPWVLEEQIRERAYFLWQEAGSPNEMHLDFWLRAEQDVWANYSQEEAEEETND